MQPPQIPYQLRSKIFEAALELVTRPQSDDAFSARSFKINNKAKPC
jgi:hypothetical protein